MATPPGRGAVRDFDEILADLAAAANPAQVAKACERIAAHLDPDGKAPDPDEDFARRELSLSRQGAMTYLRGRLDPEAGAALHSALRRRRTPNPTTRRTADAAPPPPPAPPPPTRWPPPGFPRCRNHPGWAGSATYRPSSRSASPVTARYGARFLDPATGLPLEVRRTHRIVPHWIRKALHARDRGCRWPGRDVPAA